MTNKDLHEGSTTRRHGHVLIIDDDGGIRASLDSLFRSADLHVTAFSDPSEFLEATLPDAPSCLVLDVRLRTSDGLEFQKYLLESEINMPVIIITGHGDIPMTVKGMKAGAVDFLAKPFTDEAMLRAVFDALEVSKYRADEQRRLAETRLLYATLSPREKEVMSLVASGLMNKQIAGELDLSLITVKIHRANVMRKMAAQSLADLVRLADLLNIRDRAISRFSPND
ncbi:response regulator transcription factor [Acetobacter persici]|uniref:response regulator transcription factor n=1 Tax=Acetobacter persici TaxID=1076596 RepID=UPI0036DC9A58